MVGLELLVLENGDGNTADIKSVKLARLDQAWQLSCSSWMDSKVNVLGWIIQTCYYIHQVKGVNLADKMFSLLCSTDKNEIRRQSFLCGRSSCMEQFTSSSSQSRQLVFVQVLAQNSSVYSVF